MAQSRPLSFSVVIPTYNRADLLRRTLPAIVGQHYPDFDVIVVDDGSTVDTSDLLQSEFPGVCQVRQANQGPAAARNAGIEAARGDIVAFTDDDCLAPPDWLSRLAEGYRRHPEIAGAGGYLEPAPEALRRSVLARYERAMMLRDYGDVTREYLGGLDCPAYGTNNMSYRRDVLLDVGCFDENLRIAAGEDFDLKRRACQRGQQLLFVPVRLEHLRPYTWTSFLVQSGRRGRGRFVADRLRGQRHRRSVIAARLFYAPLRFPLDVRRLGWEIAAVRLVDTLAGAAGLWTEASTEHRRFGSNPGSAG